MIESTIVRIAARWSTPLRRRHWRELLEELVHRLTRLLLVDSIYAVAVEVTLPMRQGRRIAQLVVRVVYTRSS